MIATCILSDILNAALLMPRDLLSPAAWRNNRNSILLPSAYRTRGNERNETRRGKARRQIRIQRDFRGFKREIEKFPLRSSRIRVVIIVSRWRGCEYIWLHNSSISLHTLAHVLYADTRIDFQYQAYEAAKSTFTRAQELWILIYRLLSCITSYLYLFLYIFYTMRYRTLRMEICIETTVSF